MKYIVLISVGIMVSCLSGEQASRYEMLLSSYCADLSAEMQRYLRDCFAYYPFLKKYKADLICSNVNQMQLKEEVVYLVQRHYANNLYFLWALPLGTYTVKKCLVSDIKRKSIMLRPIFISLNKMNK